MSLTTSASAGTVVGTRHSGSMATTGPCTIDGCENIARSSKTTVCEMHYYRMRRTGQYDLSTTPKPLAPSPCFAPGCTRRARHWAGDQHVCLLHKKRWDRNGHFDVVHFKSPPRAQREECGVEGCHTVDDGPHGLCKKHKSRLDRQGDPLVFIPQADRDLPRGENHRAWTGTAATYEAVHQRLRAEHGSASSYQCVDCDRDARQWSYNHHDPEEKTSEEGRPYSLVARHYRPRCVSCHKRFDLAHLRRLQ